MIMSRRGPLLLALLLVACSGGSSEAPTGPHPGGVDPGGATGPGARADAQVPPDRGDAPADTRTTPDISGLPPVFGAFCVEHKGCEGGWCVEGPDGAVCTVGCVDECPEGWACKAIDLVGAGELTSVCVPKTAKVCAPCASSSQCGGIPVCALSAEAASADEGGVCLHECAGLGSRCRGGFVCTTRPVLPALTPTWVCAPAEGGACCSKANAGATEVCEASGEHGSCAGRRVCLGDAGWSTCDAPAAVAEVCDGLDNDCDGTADDGLGPGCACGDDACDAAAGEDPRSCPRDCAACGDGVCSPGENPGACPEDCCGGVRGAGCGDGVCLGYGCGESPEACPADCGSACGNGSCDKGENPVSCAEDCRRSVCGNSVCEPTDGGPEACPSDCAAACGNCVCEGGEDFQACPIDCGSCGDGVCSACGHLLEPRRCPADCGGEPSPETCNGVDDDADGTVDEESCDDGDPCTRDRCMPDASCDHWPAGDGSRCDDGDPCTTLDRCVSGSCAGDPVGDCDDGNPCTSDGCDPETGACANRPAGDGTACDDGDDCTVDDSCAGGTCSQSRPRDCDDDNVCTADTCRTGSGCRHTATQGSCDDGNPCSENDRCEGGVCRGGGAPDCDDNDPCTLDRCDPAGPTCEHEPVPDGGPCDDGDRCTTGDTCRAGECKSGEPLDCDDGLECTLDSCTRGECTHAPRSGPCDAGDPCTVNDRCVGEVCYPGDIVDADDDGFADADCGGTDCDDTRPTVKPGLPEDCEDGHDNDCDGAVDGADRECGGAPADACDVHTDCAAGKVCARHRGEGSRRCSATCAADHHCAPTEVCSPLPGAANLGFCQPAAADGKTSGEACTEDTACRSGLCFEGYCTDFCGGQWQCRAGYSCVAIGVLADGWVVTVCGKNREGARAIGADCTFLADASDCATSHCDNVGFLPSGTCSALCRWHKDCQAGQTCGIVLYGEKEAPDAAPPRANLEMKLRDSSMACYTPSVAPGEGQLGEVCQANSFCESYFCVKIEPSAEHRVCTHFCSVADDCGDGFVCERNGLNLTGDWLSSSTVTSQPPLPEAHTLVGVCVPE